MNSCMYDESEMREEFIDTFLNHPDAFSTDHCGHWARQIAISAGEFKVRLGWEMDDEIEFNPLYGCHADPIREPDHLEAIAAFREARKVPDGYFVIDRDLLNRVFDRGMKEVGLEGIENGELEERFDEFFQLEVLGEIRYG